MSITRVISFFILVFIALFLPLWVFVIGSFLHAFIWRPYELLVLAVLIDAEFADPSTHEWYLYTILVSVVAFFTTLIRPYVRI